MSSANANQYLPERHGEVTADGLRKGSRGAGRIETRAALKHILGGKLETRRLAQIPFHQQETAAFLAANLRGLWMAAKNAELEELALLLEKALWEATRAT